MRQRIGHHTARAIDHWRAGRRLGSLGRDALLVPETLHAFGSAFPGIKLCISEERGNRIQKGEEWSSFEDR